MKLSRKSRRTGSNVRVVTARNGGQAGHVRRESEQRENFFLDIDLAELQQEHAEHPLLVDNPTSKQSQRQKQYSNSSATAQASTRGRQDSHQSDLSEFFAPVSPAELEKLEKPKPPPLSGNTLCSTDVSGDDASLDPADRR